MEQDRAGAEEAAWQGGRAACPRADPFPGPLPGPLPGPVRGVVFDLDGTLLDTERVYRAAFGETVAAFGSCLPDGAYDRLVGLPGPARRMLLPALLGRAVDAAAFAEAYYARRDRLLGPGIALKPGAAGLLALLDRLGVPAAVATSASAGTAAAHLAAGGLAGRFVAVVTRDDVARCKPAPDCFLQAARLLGVAPGACLALEDSGHGVAAAHAAGMMVAMVPDLVAPDDATAALCCVVLGSLGAVAGLLPPGREPVRAGDRSPSRV